MTCTIEGVEVVAVAYKYNTKKTLFFLAPVGAGSLAPGTPYVSLGFRTPPILSHFWKVLASPSS